MYKKEPSWYIIKGLENIGAILVLSGFFITLIGIIVIILTAIGII